MDSKRYNMSMQTYNAYITAQYYFRAHETDSIKLFSRKDPKKDGLDRHLCNNIKSSYVEYMKVKNEKPKKTKLQSKKAAKEELAKEEKAARLAHENKLKRKPQTARLEEMRQKVLSKKKRS